MASGAVAAISGIAPHVLHHVGPLAGAALLAGAGGTVLFGVAGFALSIPMLLRLRRRFGTWAAPAVRAIARQGLNARKTSPRSTLSRTRPSQNSGIDSPSKAIVISVWSAARP